MIFVVNSLADHANHQQNLAALKASLAEREGQFEGQSAAQWWQEAQRWGEGGVWRVLLHSAAGGLVGDVQGAIGAGTAAVAAPALNQMQDSLQERLIAGGMGEHSARQVAQGTTGLIGTGLGLAASGGSAAGAAGAFNTDFNNRALHVDELAILERLKKGKSKEEQQRWDDAACAATHCSAALSDNNPLKAEKAESEKRGQAYQAEIQTLLKMGFRPYTEADRQLDALVSQDPRNKAFLSKVEEGQKQQELFACKGNNSCAQTVENKYAQLLTDRAQFHISLLHYSTVFASCQDDKTCIQASLQQMMALNADLKARGEDKSNGDRIALNANISSAQWALGDIEGMMNSFGMAGIGIRASEAGNAASKAKAIKNVAGLKGGINSSVKKIPTVADVELHGYKVKDTDSWSPDYRSALEEAFKKTGVPKSDFHVTKWGIDKNGKSFPVEYRSKSGAEVNIDIGHSKGTPAPAAAHVGWQSPGKKSEGAIRGHIFVPDVPVNR